VCDAVYVIALERLREEWLASYQAQQMWGGQLPSWADVQASLDEALAEPLKAPDPERDELLGALGLRR
jgi:hypothetical protein